MSSIDLVILGIVLEKPQSAYDIQKDVEYHHFSRWTKISVQIDCDPCLDKILEEHPCIYIMQVVSLGQHRDQLIAEYQSDDDSGNRNYHRL